jgi:endonuclease/exonuclease/phosphatase family metal-dependent hydrolase
VLDPAFRPDDPLMAFKVIQFNMQFGQVWDDADPDHAPIDLDHTIEEIRSHDADIILLQEVEHAQTGGAQQDPPPNYTRLQAALPGYSGHFSYPRADPRELPFGIGLAIFSKTPLRDTMRSDLPSPAVEFEFMGEKKTPTDRLLIGAKTTIAGRDVQIYNTHLLALFMLNAHTEDHPTQRRRVVETLKASQGPTLLGGDFNVVSHEGLVKQFGAAGYKTVQAEEITWRRGPLVLDHIFYSAQLHPLRHAVKPTLASDHHVLAAEFEFAG